MYVTTTYNLIKEHLISRYKSQCSHLLETDIRNLAALRSIEITRLWLAVHHYQSENSRLNLSVKESIIHMLQMDADLTLNSLGQTLPSVVLKLLNKRCSAIDVSPHSAYQNTESQMAQWLIEQRQKRPLCFESPECLPELHWDDLPDELFPGLSENKANG